MRRHEWDPVETARLLRVLAEELLEADGATRNGLFLELHRLEDTLFRLALESHPDAPPEVAARAFDLADSLPAPQVVRTLQGLESPLVTREIRGLYKHMNLARNNMAHEAVVDRVTVSKANARRMARLARLLADQIDPERLGVPEPTTAEPSAATLPRWRAWPLAWAVAGLAAGLLLGALVF